MKIPEHVIDQINSRVSIVDIASQYVRLEKSGARFRACCPFHQEKTPSFYLTPEKNLFYCFGCHKGGTLFSFLMDLENITFLDAARILAEKAGISLDDYEGPPQNSQVSGLKELYSKIAEAFHFILTEKPEGISARRYLEQRGLSAETITQFKIGYAPSERQWLFNFLQKKKYSPEFLKKSGLFSSRYPEISLFSGRVIFPIQSGRGEVIAFGGRTLEKDNSVKYINSPETEIYRKRDNLYGFSLARERIAKTRSFYLVEGYMDVLAMHQDGVTNTVAPLGTAFTEAQARILSRYADRAILVFDGDTAGQNATKKGIFTCEKTGLITEVVEFESGSDPADVLQKQGPGALQKKAKLTINSFKYLVNNAQIDNNTNSPEGKLSILTALFPYIDCISSETKKEVYLRELSNIINIDFLSVLRDYTAYRNEGKRDFSVHIRSTKEIGKQSGTINSELSLLIAVAANFKYFEVVRNLLSIDDFEDERSRELYVIFEDCYRNDVSTIDSVLQSIENPELRSVILSKISTDEFRHNQEEYIKDAVTYIRLASLKKQKARVEEMLRLQDFSRHSERELQEESMFLLGEIKKLKVRD